MATNCINATMIPSETQYRNGFPICPRCGGQVLDLGGEAPSCLQCSYESSQEPTPSMLKELPNTSKPFWRYIQELLAESPQDVDELTSKLGRERSLVHSTLIQHDGKHFVKKGSKWGLVCK